MNRDSIQPAETQAAYHAGMVAGNVLTVARRGELAGQLPAAAGQIRGVLAADWPAVTPEAATIVLVSATALAVDSDATTAALYAAVDTAAADPDVAVHARTLLELARKPPARPVRLLASSLAFDRDEDDTTLAVTAVLFAVALVPGQPPGCTITEHDGGGNSVISHAHGPDDPCPLGDDGPGWEQVPGG